MTKLLILAEPRCGGTNLVRAIGSHPDVRFKEPNGCQELIWNRQREGKDLPNGKEGWYELLAEFWEDRELWHLQRYQLSVAGWEALIAHKPRMVVLYREDKVAQFLSWRYSMLTGDWHGTHRQPLADAYWGGGGLFIEKVRGWEEGETFVRENFPQDLWISYEQLENGWEKSIAKCLGHFELRQILLPPMMVKPAAIDYFSMFGLQREKLDLVE